MCNCNDGIKSMWRDYRGELRIHICTECDAGLLHLWRAECASRDRDWARWEQSCTGTPPAAMPSFAQWCAERNGDPVEPDEEPQLPDPEPEPTDEDTQPVQPIVMRDLWQELKERHSTPPQVKPTPRAISPGAEIYDQWTAGYQF